MKIKYFKVQCKKCKEVYTVNLSLSETKLFCYKCGDEMVFPDIDKAKIDAVNEAMKEVEKDYRTEPDGDGLIISFKTANIITGAKIMTSSSTSF
jgi:ribosomal protein S27E